MKKICVAHIGDEMKTTAPPEYIAKILNTLVSDGHESVIVGGSVRDAIMSRPVHDWDLATSATPVDVARLFPKTVLTGEKFGTVTVVIPEGSVEITTFRTEGEYIDGRHPEEVEFVSNLTEDLSRRDFTINAMAESVDGELIDPFGGIEDINNGIIRCVGGPNTRFSEDALRMFRALRFSAEFGFTIEKETKQAIYANAGLASRLSSERVRIELEKTLMSQKPEVAGEMIKIGLLDKYMAVSGKSPDGLEKLTNLPPEPMLRWCVFCAILLEKQYISSAAELLRAMHLDGKTIKTCSRALELSAFPKDKIGIKRLLSKNDVAVVRCAAAINDTLLTETVNETEGANKVNDDLLAKSAIKRLDAVLLSKECATLGELAITGSDLIGIGHQTGCKLGETLSKLLEHVIENPGDNTRERLLEVSNKL